MPILAARKIDTQVRPITPDDVPDISRLIDSAWRVCLRTSPYELKCRLKTFPGFLARDTIGLRGFMIIEPETPDLAFLAAAGLRDTWRVEPYLDLLLPPLETTARARGLHRLIYIGSADWLIVELKKRAFATRQWVVMLERDGSTLPPAPPTAARLSRVSPPHLPALTRLDALAFDDIWHKAIGRLADALTKGDYFMLAELGGQPVGYIWAEIFGDHAHLTRLAVRPDFQGRGIGAQLLYQAMADVFSRGVTHLSLNTQADNLHSLALYRRFGFTSTGQQMPMLIKTLD